MSGRFLKCFFGLFFSLSLLLGANKHSSSHSFGFGSVSMDSLCLAPCCLVLEPEGEEGKCDYDKKVWAFPLLNTHSHTYTNTHIKPLPFKGHSVIPSDRGHHVFNLVYTAGSNLVSPYRPWIWSSHQCDTDLTCSLSKYMHNYTVQHPFYIYVKLSPGGSEICGFSCFTQGSVSTVTELALWTLTATVDSFTHWRLANWLADCTVFDCDFQRVKDNLKLSGWSQFSTRQHTCCCVIYKLCFMSM